MATQGGPAKSVSVQTGGRQQGGPAIPIAVVTDGRAVEGGPALPIYVVTSGPVLGGPALPVVAAPAGARAAAGPAVPAFVVSGSFSSIFDYTNKVKALSPIAYWPQAESSGSVATDESGSGRNGAYTNVVLGQTGIGDGRTAPSFNGTTAFNNVYSAGLAGAINVAEGTLAVWAKVANVGVWTDGQQRAMGIALANGSNRLFIVRNAANNTITFEYDAGGTAKTVSQGALSSIGWNHYAMTWSKSNDQLKGYINGAQIGATQTGLGVWAGAIDANWLKVGAGDSIWFWSGFLAHAALWNTPLSAAQIATLAVVP